MSHRQISVALVGSLVLFASANSPAFAFDEGDLEGDWFGVSMYVRSVFNAPWVTQYQFAIDAEGGVSGGYTDYPDTAPAREYEVLEGFRSRLEITPEGVVDGTVRTTNEGLEEVIPQLQMNAATDFMVGIETNKDGTAAHIFLFAKSGGAYEPSDLAGEWKIAGYSEQLTDTHGAVEITGHVELDDEGVVASPGSIAFGNQGTLLVPGILFEIDAGGGVTTDPDLGGDFLMQLAEGRTLAIGRAVGWETNGGSRQQIYIFVKTAAGAVDADMAGDWVLKRFSDQGAENAPRVTAGTLQVDESGTSIVGGELEVGLGEWTVEGGVVETDDEGGVALSDISYVGSDVVTTGDVYLEASRGVFAGHATDSDGRIALVVGVPEPASALLGITSLAALLALRRRSAPRAACRP